MLISYVLILSFIHINLKSFSLKKIFITDFPFQSPTLILANKLENLRSLAFHC